MISLMIMAFALTLATVARIAFRSWYNHASIYSFIWGTSLALFELRLIEYYPLSAETWVYIGGAWIAFFIGSVVTAEPDIAHGNVGSVSERRLRWTIVVLTAIAMLSIAHHWFTLIARFGSVLNVIVYGNIVYSLRLSEDLGTTLPYLDSFAIAACLFGGMYHAQQDRLKPLALLPLVAVILESLAGMGRAKMLISLLLYFSGYFLARKRVTPRGVATRSRRIPRWVGISMSVVLVLFAAETIRSKRAAETFMGASEALNRLQGSSVITPSLYLYLTVHHGVFNQYLKDRSPLNYPVGGYTFAPLYRAFSRFGVGTPIPYYDRFYNTPASANTGTYLLQLHHDFGIVAIFVLPFLFGLACTTARSWYMRTGKLLHLALTGHLYAVVGASILVGATRWGYWLVSILVAMFAGWWLDGSRKQTTAE